jgi:tetratricopeptide (TPR) repeat protein
MIMLDVFITSRVRRKIIVVYAKYPDFKTHVRGLAKLIKEDPGNIQRELKRLEKLAERGHFLARILSLKISTEHFIDENILQQRLQRVPSDVKQFGAYAYYVRAEALLHLGRTEAALAEFEKALQVDPRSASSRLALAQLLYKMGERERAKQQIRSLLEFHPEHIPALIQSSKW